MNVRREISRSFLIAKLLPAIVTKWPQEDARKTIWIQQDNAPSHVLVGDEIFAGAVAQIGLDIRIMQQPSNSPDMNVLDLGFFASLQSKTYLKNARNMDELVANVEKVYYKDYNADLVNRIFLTLQSCLIEVMKVGGGNGYKIPHMNKDRLQRLGTLPARLLCDLSLYQDVMQKLGN